MCVCEGERERDGVCVHDGTTKGDFDDSLN